MLGFLHRCVKALGGQESEVGGEWKVGYKVGLAFHMSTHFSVKFQVVLTF